MVSQMAARRRRRPMRNGSSRGSWSSEYNLIWHVFLGTLGFAFFLSILGAFVGWELAVQMATVTVPSLAGMAAAYAGGRSWVKSRNKESELYVDVDVDVEVEDG